ncbi:unnamed protein product [Prunus brigantina]
MSKELKSLIPHHQLKVSVRELLLSSFWETTFPTWSINKRIQSGHNYIQNDIKKPREKNSILHRIQVHSHLQELAVPIMDLQMDSKGMYWHYGSACLRSHTSASQTAQKRPRV